MDPKDLRIDTALNDRSNISSNYAHCPPTFQSADKNKPYHDIGPNSSSKLDVSNGRPCAVIGPDRVVPPQPVSGDPYVKKGHSDPWQFTRPPEYSHRIPDYPLYVRNISPRQTFQENMQRIMMPPRCDPVKSSEDPSYITDKSESPSKSLQKTSRTQDLKYYEVPYAVNSMNNDQKCIKASTNSGNPAYERSPAHGWQQGNVNIQPTPPYGATDLHQYQEFPNGAVPRQVHMNHPHRTGNNEPIRVYPDPYYRAGTTRYEPYPAVKERYSNSRYDPIANYPRTYYPPFPQQKYDVQKISATNIPPASYTGYPQTSIKYTESKLREPIREAYPRPPPNYNVSYHNQSLYHGYGSLAGNCLQNKLYPFAADSASTVRPQYDPKAYIKYDNGHMKHHTFPENVYFNDISRNHQMKGPLAVPNYPINLQPHVSPYHYGRKDNTGLRNYEYNLPFKNGDPNINNYMSKIPSHFSPNLISPVESNASSDASHNYALSQEDFGYVSQSSNASVRSMESSGLNMHRVYDSRYGYINQYSPRVEMESKSKGKKGLDVRQFLQMWNEGEEENNDSDITSQGSIPKTTDHKNQELYVLGLVNVPREELGKYEHIQKVSKLPENIKGYTSLDLLNQFEEAIESSNLENYSRPIPKESLHVQTQNVIPDNSINRPVSPLDVESKISQSVIHKEVGCNFEIKPCSPKMLNVEIPSSAQKMLDERIIEKVTNPLVNTPVVSNIDNCNVIKHQQNRKSLRNDFKNNTSCKLAKIQCSVESTDINKSAYSIQDLESISGVCLASLPRLDNDIELNFPEVNQQFIDANKPDCVALSTDNVSDVKKHNIDTEPNLSPPSPSENEFSKLSRYRKLKNDKDGQNQQKSFQQLRTDSVIIKNPESSENENINKHVQSYKEDSKFNKTYSHCSPIDLRNNRDYDNHNTCVVVETEQNSISEDNGDSLNITDTSTHNSTDRIVYPEKEYLSVETSEIIQDSKVMEYTLQELHNEDNANKSLSEIIKSNVKLKEEIVEQNTNDMSLGDTFLKNKLNDPQIVSPNSPSDANSNVNNTSNDGFDVHLLKNNDLELNTNDVIDVYKEDITTIEYCEIVKDLPNPHFNEDILKPDSNPSCADPDGIMSCSGAKDLTISSVVSEHDNEVTASIEINADLESDIAKEVPKDTLKKSSKVEENYTFNILGCVNKSDDCSTPSLNNETQGEDLVDQEQSISVQLELSTDCQENSHENIEHDNSSEKLDVYNLISESVIMSKRRNSTFERTDNEIIDKIVIVDSNGLESFDNEAKSISAHSDVNACVVEENQQNIEEPRSVLSTEIYSDLPREIDYEQCTKYFSKKQFSWLIDKLCLNTSLSTSIIRPAICYNKISSHVGMISEACKKVKTLEDFNINSVTNIHSEDHKNETSDSCTLASHDLQLPNTDSEDQIKPHRSVENNRFGIVLDTVVNNTVVNRGLKRSLSESDVERSKYFCKSKCNIEGPLFLSHKRKKIEDNVNDLQAFHMTEEGLNTLIQNRRNSISSLYYDENGSFCILIDDDCILEQGCDADTCGDDDGPVDDNHLPIVEKELVIDNLVKEDVSANEVNYEPFSHNAVQDKNCSDDWVDDIGCVETVVSDTVENDEIDNETVLETAFTQTSTCGSPLNTDLDKAYSQACQNNFTSIFVDKAHTKNILGDMNRTLNTPFMGECSTNPFKDDLLDSIFTDKTHTNIDNTDSSTITESNFLDVKENICNSVEKIMTKIHDDMTLMHNDKLLSAHDNPLEADINLSDMSGTEHYHRSSSSSPEVSSTTSEDKKSRIRLKITNFNGSITSELNHEVFENKSIRYKLTEETDYRTANPKPFITKAAQKYIPPLKDTVKDLKVKLVLPHNTLIKFKEMKQSKDIPKNDLAKPKVIKSVTNNVTRSSKKIKPNFEDVLKNIDVVQFQLHKERTKKTKKPVPKVVIKKTENGSHYTSNGENNDDYNPDLTGRKWQPWVFIEKNSFVDKMARKGKTKAIYCHETKTYKLRVPLNLPRYKHPGTNYEISRPKTEQDPSSLLKYTIRLKHN